MKRNTANQKVRVFAFDYTTGAPKAGIAATITCNASLDYAGEIAVTDTNPTEVAGGYYEHDLTQAETNAHCIEFRPATSTTNASVIALPAIVYTEALLTADYDAAKIAAPASTALSTNTWTAAKAAFLDSAISACLQASAAPTNFSDLSITASTGIVKANDFGGNALATASVLALAALEATSQSIKAKTDISVTSGVWTNTKAGFVDAAISGMLAASSAPSNFSVLSISAGTGYVKATGVNSEELAPASTALSTSTWNATKAGYLDISVASRLAASAAPSNFDSLSITPTTGFVKANDSNGNALATAANLALSALEATAQDIKAKTDISVTSGVWTNTKAGFLDAAISLIPTSNPSEADIKTALEANGSKLDHLWEMTEDDGGVRRLTTNALEQAPAGGGASGGMDVNLFYVRRGDTNNRLRVLLLDTNGDPITGLTGSTLATASVTTIQNGDAGTNPEIQEVSISPTDAVGGTFTLSFQGTPSAPINYDANAAEVETAVDAITGGVGCTGGPLPGVPVTITWEDDFQDKAELVPGNGSLIASTGTSGLNVDTIADTEAAVTTYSGTTLIAITTIGGESAGTACLFGATPISGVYEVILPNARFSQTGSKQLHLRISGAASLAPYDATVILTPVGATGVNGETLAPASTALSTSTWNATKAGYLSADLAAIKAKTDISVTSGVWTNAKAAFVDAAISAIPTTAAATVTAIRSEIDSNSTQLIAIKAKTDIGTTAGVWTNTKAGYLDAAVSSISGGTGLNAEQTRVALGMSAANLDTQLGAIPTAAEIDTQLSGTHGTGSWGGAVTVVSATEPIGSLTDVSLSAQQNCIKSWTFDTDENLSAKALAFKAWRDDPASVDFTKTNADGISVSGANSDLVTVTLSATNTAYALSYSWRMENTTDDKAIANGTLIIEEGPA